MAFCSQPRGCGKGRRTAAPRNFPSFCRMVQKRDKASSFQKPLRALLGALPGTLSVSENVFLQESDPHVISQFQNDSKDGSFICICSHYLLISILWQSALYYLKGCSLSVWLFQLVWPVPFLFCSKYRPISALARDLPKCQLQRAKEKIKRAQLAICSQAQCISFLCLIPCLCLLSLHLSGWRRQGVEELKILIKIVLIFQIIGGHCNYTQGTI